MIKRFAAITALLTLSATPSHAAQVTGQAAIKVVKPIVLSKLQDLDFGTVTLSGAPGSQTIGISQAGVVSCPASVVCGGTPKAASFNIKGSAKAVVTLTVPNISLSNGSDTIPFTANAPATVTIPNSGNAGTTFGIGGSVAVVDTVEGGTYTGTITITAEYQ